MGHVRCLSEGADCALPLLTKCVGGDGLASDGRCQQQEHLWQHFLLEPTMWWDKRREGKAGGVPASLAFHSPPRSVTEMPHACQGIAKVSEAGCCSIRAAPVAARRAAARSAACSLHFCFFGCQVPSAAALGDSTRSSC